jgi:hypothetical protein
VETATQPATSRPAHRTSEKELRPGDRSRIRSRRRAPLATRRSSERPVPGQHPPLCREILRGRCRRRTPSGRALSYEGLSKATAQQCPSTVGGDAAKSGRDSRRPTPSPDRRGRRPADPPRPRRRGARVQRRHRRDDAAGEGVGGAGRCRYCDGVLSRVRKPRRAPSARATNATTSSSASPTITTRVARSLIPPPSVPSHARMSSGRQRRTPPRGGSALEVPTLPAASCQQAWRPTPSFLASSRASIIAIQFLP